MKLGRWSTVAGSNNATPPDGWPEGQAPSTVNDCARELMAAIRVAFSDLQFFDQDLSPTYVNATNFTVPGDQTSAIHAGRRLKIYDATAGAATTIYATVVTASFTVVTTVNVANDAGQLTSSLSSFAIAIISVNNPSVTVSDLDRMSASAIETTTLTVSGATVLNGIMTCVGAATFRSTVTVSGTLVALRSLDVQLGMRVGGQFSAASLFVVTDTFMAGNLTVSGITVLGGSLSISGNAQVSGTFQVAGTTTLSGAVTMNSTLTVSGALAVLGNFVASGASNFFPNLSANNITVAGQLSVSGTCVHLTASRFVGVASCEGAVTMASTLTVSGAAVNLTTTRMVGVASAEAGVVAPNAAKAWVAFSGVGVVTLGNRYNVTSITDSALGAWVVNITSALSGTGYAVVAFLENDAASPNMIVTHSSADQKTTTTYGLRVINAGGTATDAPLVHAVFFGT